MVRNNIRNIVISFLLIGSSLFVMSTCSENQKATNQLNPPPTTNITDDERKQSIYTNLLRCLNEYKLFIQTSKLDTSQCPYYDNKDRPNLILWQQDYYEYVNNVSRAEQLQSHRPILDIIENRHSRNLNNIEFLQKNITQLTNTSTNADALRKLQKNLEASIKTIENNLKEIQAIDEYSKSKDATTNSQGSLRLITQVDLWSIIVDNITNLIILGVIIWLIWQLILYRLKKQKEELNAPKNILLPTKLISDVENPNNSFSSEQFENLMSELSGIKEFLIKEKSWHENTTNEIAKIALKFENIVSENLNVLINEAISRQLEENLKKLDLDKYYRENERLKKENGKLNDQIYEYSEDLKSLQEQIERDQREIKSQKDKIVSLNKKINDLEYELENRRYSYRDDERITRQLPPSKEREEPLKTQINVDLLPEIADFVTKYNKDPESLWQYANRIMIEVAEPKEYYDQRRRDNNQPIVLKNSSSETDESEYCVIPVTTEKGQVNLLFPKNNKINDILYQVICGHNSLFECSGSRERDINKFVIEKPATVFLRDSSQKEWQLKERGKLKFIE